MDTIWIPNNYSRWNIFSKTYAVLFIIGMTSSRWNSSSITSNNAKLVMRLINKLIILPNHVEFPLILSRRGRRTSWLKSGDIPQHWARSVCFIIQFIDNKAQFYCRKAGGDLYFAIFLPDTRNYVYRRISLDYGRRIFSAPWPYLASVTLCVK